MKSPKWWLVLLVLVIFAPFLLQPGSVLFSPHSDFVLVHFPARYMFSDSLRNYQQLPLWSPYQFCGSPQLGDWHCQWFYPFTWLYALVAPSGTLRVMGYQVALHLILGGLGMYHYLKGQNLSRPARLLGALIFMLNGKWIAHLLVAQHPIQGWAWLPWVMASMDRLQKRPRWGETALLVCLLALLALGSIPPFIALCVYFLAAYGCFLLVQAGQRSRVFLSLLGACLWSGAVCCSTLWPAAEFARLCTRGAGLTISQASQGEIPGYILPCLPAWPTSPLAVGWEMTLYCGAVPCLLAALCLFRRPRGREVFFLAASAIMLLLALGQQTPFFSLCFHLLPGFSLFRYPARYAMLLGISVAYLAARQVDQKDPLPRLGLAVLLSLSLIVALAGQMQFGRSEGWISFVLIGLGALTRFLPRGRALLIGLTAAELSFFTFQVIDPRPFDEVLRPHLLAEQLKQPLGSARTLATISQMLTLPYATLNGVESANGLTALIPKVTLDYLQLGVGGAAPKTGEVLTGIPVLEPRSVAFLRRGNIQSVVSDHPLGLNWPALTTPAFRCYDFLQDTGFLDFPPLLLYRDARPLPRYRLVGKGVACSSWEQALAEAGRQDPSETVVLETAQIQAAGPQSAPVGWRYANYQRRLLEVQVQSPGAYLVFSEPYYPGWVLHSTTRELPLLRADGFFLAAYLEPGSHQLTLEYAPASFPRSLLLSALSLGLALLTLWLNRPTRTF